MRRIVVWALLAWASAPASALAERPFGLDLDERHGARVAGRADGREGPRDLLWQREQASAIAAAPAPPYGEERLSQVEVPEVEIPESPDASQVVTPPPDGVTRPEPPRQPKVDKPKEPPPTVPEPSAPKHEEPGEGEEEEDEDQAPPHTPDTGLDDGPKIHETSTPAR